MATEVGVGYVSIVPSVKGFGSKLAAETTAAGTAAGVAGGGAAASGWKSAMGKALPFAAVATAGVAASLKVDKAFQQVIRRTGAGGSAADELRASFEKVGSQTGANLTEVGDVLGTLNSRLGITGTSLEDMSLRMIKLAGISGGDAVETADSASRAMAKWGVSAEDSAGFIDMLLTASQKTGIGVASLTDTLTTAAAPLSGLGFSAAESTALIAGMDKAGVNTTAALTGMRTGMAKLAAAGEKDLPAAFKKTVASIKSAKTSAEATGIAVELFGTRAGPELARGIRNGTLGIEDLTASLENSGGALDKTAGNTNNLEKQWKRLLNKLTILASKLGDLLMPILMTAADWLGKIVDWVMQMPGPFQVLIGGVLALVGALKVWAIAQAALNLVLTANPIGIIVMAIAALVAGIVWAYNNVDWFRNAVDAAWDAIQAAFQVVVDFLTQTVWPAFKKVFDFIVGLIRWYLSVWRKIWDTAWTIVETVIGWITKAWQGWFGVIRKVGEVVSNVFNAVRDTIAGVINWMVDKIAWVVDKIQKAWDFLMQLLGVQADSEAQPGGGSGDGGGTTWASGGFVPTDTKGTVHGGEFVLTRQQVAQVGVGRLESWRKGGQPPGGGGFNVGQVVINNPRPEPASDSLPRSIRKLAYLGGTA